MAMAEFPLDLPDFNGQVRLMAVAWSGSSLGAAASDVYVRDPLVAEPLLPRFLAPGDQTRLTLLLHNLELPAGEQVVTVSVDGPLAVSGAARLAATLAPGAQALPFTTLTATGAGSRRSSGWTSPAPAASTSSARPRSPCVRRAVRRRWSPPASLRREPRCSLPRRSISSWRGPGRPRRASAARCATTWPGWCRRSTAIRSGAWSRRPAAASRSPCCRTARWRGRTAPRGCNRRWASCSIASASMAASACGRRRRRRSRGSRSTPPSS